MPGQRKVGMDHDLWDWSPMYKRPVLRWPEGAQIAVCLLVDLGHYDWKPPEGAFDPPSHTPPMSMSPYPDLVTVTYREYGHRVGIFRVMEVLDKYNIKATVPMDAYTADHYPILVKECQQRGWEIIGHGVTQRQAITSLMSDDEEKQYIQRSLDALRQATGQMPAGWLGPEHCQSARTPALLAEMGIRYVCDFPNDEQPYRVHTPTGELYSLPVMIELGDVMGHFNRKVTIQRWVQMVQEAFDVIYQEGKQNGRMLVLNLHPWCIGQPYRIKYLEQVIEHMVRRQGVWMATGSEIIDWYRTHPPGS